MWHMILSPGLVWNWKTRTIHIVRTCVIVLQDIQYHVCLGSLRHWHHQFMRHCSTRHDKSVLSPSFGMDIQSDDFKLAVTSMFLLLNALSCRLYANMCKRNVPIYKNNNRKITSTSLPSWYRTYWFETWQLKGNLNILASVTETIEIAQYCTKYGIFHWHSIKHNGYYTESQCPVWNWLVWGIAQSLYCLEKWKNNISEKNENNSLKQQDFDFFVVVNFVRKFWN